MRGAQQFKIDIPQPRGFAGKIFAADSVYNNDNRAGFLIPHGHTDGLVIRNGIFVFTGQ